jgi:hypothetical protein
MENTKKIIKVVNGLVYIVVLVLIGVIVYQNHQIRKLTYALNSANESTGKPVSVQDDITQKSATRNAAPVAKRNGQDDFDDIRYQLEAAEEELDMAHEQVADEIARNDENANSMMQGPMTMLKTPEGKKRLRNALKNGFDQSYSSLFKEMNLSPEKIDQLKELLADQQIASMELSNELQNASTTEEDRKNLQKQLEEQNNQNDTALAALLGDQNFETFSDYKDRSRERNMIQMFSQRLSYDDTLTGDQKKSLLESLYNKRKDAYSQQGYDEENMNFPFDTNGEGILKMMEMNLLVYDEYIKGVEEAALSESQKMQLTKYLEEDQTRMKSSMELQARVASGEIDPDSAKEEGEAEGMAIIFDY